LVNIVDDIIEGGRKKGILQLYTEDKSYNGRIITIEGKELLNFGSCSYLGLELDARLKLAAIYAINRYGIQYSSSRSYVSTTLYKELEDLIKQIFNAFPVLSPTTTLGHQAVIPTILEEGDVIFLDQQVHASVQYAALNMQLKGIDVSVIRHNSMEDLEKAIEKVHARCKRVWYMADGIYSMYGDYIPIASIMKLLNKYPKLHLYVDDAHGMSWTGRNGKGFVLGNVDIHERMIVGTSLAKGFGTGGGVFLFKNERTAQKVRNCGGPLIFSGPNQIPVIAASIASAKIHLSPEIYKLQNDLQEKIKYCHELMVQHKLPVISNPETPIKFIGLGLAQVGYNMVSRMLRSGFYCNLAVFPAVPQTCSGLRFTITTHHTFSDIEKLVAALTYHLPKALADEGRTLEDVHRAFRKVTGISNTVTAPVSSKNTAYKVQHEKTIRMIPREMWDKLLCDGTFDWNFLKMLETVYSNNSEPENNWDFDYYIIWKDNVPEVATFFTTSICKDDMLSSSAVSSNLESERRKDPYYLCSKTMMMGSPLTEGRHIYINRKSDWKEPLMVLLDRVWNKQINDEINTLCLRDFDNEDLEIKEFLQDQGFIKMNLPDNNIIHKLQWNSDDEFIMNFNSRKRWYLKNNVLKYTGLFDFKIVKHPSEEQIDHWYSLYKNVKGRGMELNTFDLPKKLFKELVLHSGAEVLQLSLKGNDSISGIVAVSFNLLSKANNYCGIIIGLDYNYLESHSVYKQMLYRSVLRAGEVKANKMFLGFTASEVKGKFGAERLSQSAYIQMQDNFNLSVLNTISNKAAKI
ncbi:MAG: aminotransferase class, partial [Bacteroidetes bacterium]|nr:aminotransferase class [Bacteroidota bacterium]